MYNVKYIQTESRSDVENNHSNLFTRKKGSLTLLMRNHFVGRTYETCNNQIYISLGMFEKLWDVKQSVDTIFAKSIYRNEMYL